MQGATERVVCSCCGVEINPWEKKINEDYFIEMEKGTSEQYSICRECKIQWDIKEKKVAILIKMKDGTTYLNDPDIGLNLDDVDEINECINSCRYYDLTIPSKYGSGTTSERVYRDKVLEVVKM